MLIDLCNREMSVDISCELQARVIKASENKTPLRIQGGNSKAFYGNVVKGEVLELSGHRGVTNYEPTELVISAHAGTPLNEIEAVLDKHNQKRRYSNDDLSGPCSKRERDIQRECFCG